MSEYSLNDIVSREMAFSSANSRSDSLPLVVSINSGGNLFKRGFWTLRRVGRAIFHD